jgi:hypothetical protein
MKESKRKHGITATKFSCPGLCGPCLRPRTPPMRIYFMHTDLSSLPRTVYPFVLPGSSFRRPCSSDHLLMSGYTLFSNINIYHLLNDTSLSPPDTPIDPLRSSPPRPTVHPGAPVANRTSTVTVTILGASLHTVKTPSTFNVSSATLCTAEGMGTECAKLPLRNLYQRELRIHQT